VVLFLIVTTGLLVYALIRPYVQSWLAVSVHLGVGGLMGFRLRRVRDRDGGHRSRSMRRYRRRVHGEFGVEYIPNLALKYLAVVQSS